MARKERASVAAAFLFILSLFLLWLGPPLALTSFLWLLFWYTGVVNDVSAGPAWVNWAMEYGMQLLIWVVCAAGSLFWILAGRRDCRDA